MNKNIWKNILENNKNYKLIFIHTPKCGGTYCAQILKDLNITNKKHIQANKNEGLTFTIIRDPIERFESFLNYRLCNPERDDWPKKLSYVYSNKNVSLNEIVDKLDQNNIDNFYPYRTLIYWSKNIDIFITIDQLYEFLTFCGYNYNPDNYKKLNVSIKERGILNEEMKNKIRKLYNDDIIFYNKIISST